MCAVHPFGGPGRDSSGGRCFWDEDPAVWRAYAGFGLLAAGLVVSFAGASCNAVVQPGAIPPARGK